MEELYIYLQLGFKHISDINGYDHILFIITLCALYNTSDFKRVLLLITAFTLGHSFTLALATLHLVVINAYWVELLIPVTILCAALYDVFNKNNDKQLKYHYIMALVFGLIHGMGFSNFFNAISIDGAILIPLLGFNVGLEIGQLLIVVLFFSLYFVFLKLKTMNHRIWKLILSGSSGLASLFLIIERI